MTAGQRASGATGPPVDRAAVRGFRAGLRGEVLCPDDEGYDAARRVWNATIDRRPALIARCAGAADVIAAVRFARERELLVSVRGGGHNVAGLAVCDGGLMIDLSPMKSVRVDPLASTARAEPGVLWGEFDRETQAFGLATPGGMVSTTGIAGLTLGGGEGWLSPKHGLACDNLLSADVVTADGRLLTASADEHPDLFWAIRGGGGNFGVVTSFEYRLHPLGPAVLGGMVTHPIERAAEALRFFREFMASPPDELAAVASLGTALDGTQGVTLWACYAGPPDEGERALAPLRRFGPPVADTVGPLPYTAVQSLWDQRNPYGRGRYWKSSLLREISDELIEVVVAHVRRLPMPLTGVSIVGLLHGAKRRVGKTDTAYFHRDAAYDMPIASNWTDPADAERGVAWTRGLYEALRPHLPDMVYMNVLDQDDGARRVRQAYGENYARLAELKAAYDPTNFFRMNHNIRPAARG